MLIKLKLKEDSLPDIASWGWLEQRFSASSDNRRRLDISITWIMSNHGLGNLCILDSSFLSSPRAFAHSKSRRMRQGDCLFSENKK
jgi:hypothetical protein